MIVIAPLFWIWWMMGVLIMSRTILVTIIDDSEKEPVNKCYFAGNDLTSPEDQAITWLLSQEKDVDHEQ